MAYDSQIETVRNFEVPPDPRYVVTKYQVEQWPNRNLCVTRKYRDPAWNSAMQYSQCFAIGPRGGIKTIYNSLY